MIAANGVVARMLEKVSSGMRGSLARVAGNERGCADTVSSDGDDGRFPWDN
jgi:hypothetical protein